MVKVELSEEDMQSVAMVQVVKELNFTRTQLECALAEALLMVTDRDAVKTIAILHGFKQTMQ